MTGPTLHVKIKKTQKMRQQREERERWNIEVMESKDPAKICGIPEGGPACGGNRNRLKLYHSPYYLQHPAVFSGGSADGYGGNDVFYAGGGDVHDSHGRKSGRADDPE